MFMCSRTSTTLHRPQVSAYNSDVYSVYSEGRSVDWCSKIHNPGHILHNNILYIFNMVF